MTKELQYMSFTEAADRHKQLVTRYLELLDMMRLQYRDKTKFELMQIEIDDLKDDIISVMSYMKTIAKQDSDKQYMANITKSLDTMITKSEKRQVRFRESIEA